MIGIAIAGLAMSAQVQPPSPSAASTIESLAWLSGEWEQRRPSGPHVVNWTREQWSRPRAGVMLGTSLSARVTVNHLGNGGEQVRSFEFMRIARDSSGRITFYGSPGGAPAVAFPIARMERYAIVFENPAHDYPQRIAYRWDASTIGGETLVATVSLLDGSRPMTWTYRRPQPQP